MRAASGQQTNYNYLQSCRQKPLFQILLYLISVISQDNLNNAMASVFNVYAWCGAASGNVSGLEMANMATCQVTPSSRLQQPGRDFD